MKSWHVPRQLFVFFTFKKIVLDYSFFFSFLLFLHFYLITKKGINMGVFLFQKETIKLKKKMPNNINNNDKI